MTGQARGMLAKGVDRDGAIGFCYEKGSHGLLFFLGKSDALSRTSLAPEQDWAKEESS